MMEEVQREWNTNPQVDRPPLDKMLEWLWTDIHNNSLNKDGAFYIYSDDFFCFGAYTVEVSFSEFV